MNLDADEEKLGVSAFGRTSNSFTYPVSILVHELSVASFLCRKFFSLAHIDLLFPNTRNKTKPKNKRCSNVPRDPMTNDDGEILCAACANAEGITVEANSVLKKMIGNLRVRCLNNLAGDGDESGNTAEDHSQS